MVPNPTTPYRLSFSACGLCVFESVQLAQLYLERRDWDDVKGVADNEKLLGFRTQSSSKRTLRELIARLLTLSEAELKLLIETDRSEQALLIWLAVCRTYPFVAQFATEVLQERVMSLRMAVSYSDFDQFYDDKAEWNDALAKISPSTRTKLRQVLFRMLREADILSKDGTLHPVYLPVALKDDIIKHDPKGLNYFPTTQTDRGVR